MSSNGVAVEESEFGKGVFAIRDLQEGEKILVLTGKPIQFNETLLMGIEESFCVQMGMDHYIIPDHPFYLINHSCDPNTGVNGTMELITLRSVSRGEEIFWDYSTSMLERHWTMECECRTPLCRGIINDFDRLPEDLQKKYLQKGIVFPFIREWILQIAK